MRKFFWIPLVLMTMLALGCNKGTASAGVESSTTTQAAGIVAEVTPSTAVVSITTTGPGNPAAKAPNVSVVAEKATVAVGDTFQVVVVVDILDNMSRGSECELAWTPASLVQCVQVADGDFYAKFKPVHMGASGPNAIHNDKGTVASMGQFCTSEPSDAGASGKGVLFIYNFKALQKGQVTFSVPADSLLVGDVSGDTGLQIDAVNSATVTVQ